MTPLRLIRRFHAPLCGLAIACIFSVGCTTNRETLSLGPPAEAYRADNGSVVFGYYVQPKIKPDHAGWHWLVVEPDTARELTLGGFNDSTPPSPPTVVVTYEGWRRNARLTPPLLEPGLPDRTPPTIGSGSLDPLRFVWDDRLGAVRLLGAEGATLSVMRVSPGQAELIVREYDSELGLDILTIALVAGLVVGLVFAGGSGSFSSN